MVTKNPLLDRLTTYPAEALYAKKRALHAAGVEVYDFSVGDPIEPTDRRIVEAFVGSVPAISQYPTAAGSDEIRDACAGWVQRRFDVTLDPSTQILPSSGSKEAIFHLPLVFIDRDSERRRVLFGAPAYPVYERGALFAGAEPWAVELDAAAHYRLEPWSLDATLAAKTAILWINYPHNPTGATVDRAYLERVAAFCAKHDILLCSDECYVDLYLDDDKPPSLLEVADSGVLTFHSLSKRSGMTGYRSGFIAGDPSLIGRLRAARANFGVAQSTMIQQTSVAAWSDDTHASERRKLFRDKRDVMTAFFEEAGIEHRPCKATFYLWFRTPGESGADALAHAEHLADHGILISPAPLLGVDQPYARVALVPDLDRCMAAIERWRAALQKQGEWAR